jgi:uncharacterized protein
MMWSFPLLAFSLLLPWIGKAQEINLTCPDYFVYANERHGPFSTGAYNLSYQRPPVRCRTFNSSMVEDTITSLKGNISDPDLYRLFENSYPNTFDTAIKWRGYAANNSDEELTFIITGDINAMWLRDSANQLQSYLPLLRTDDSFDSIASLYRGAINLQSRYINTSPHCNAFQPPKESGLELGNNSYGATDQVFPPYSNQSVFECKYELDSLAAFLQVSHDYYTTTNDISFFSQFQWLPTIQTILTTVYNLTNGTYDAGGRVLDQPYTWERLTTSSTETLANLGHGNPVLGGTGLIRSAFRPSDDSTIYQLFIPANMMFSYYLNSTASIMARLSHPLASDLSSSMTTLASTIRSAISSLGTTTAPNGETIFSFETDGYGSHNLMDDANIPSLLSAPFFGYSTSDPTYQSTRNYILSAQNSYYMRGPVINAIGGPHQSFGMAWPMASIVRILTSDDDDEIRDVLREIVSSTDGYGLIHESINSWNVSDWTRQWFSWANGLFGQMVVDLSVRKPGLLGESYQPT